MLSVITTTSQNISMFSLDMHNKVTPTTVTTVDVKGWQEEECIQIYSKVVKAYTKWPLTFPEVSDSSSRGRPQSSWTVIDKVKPPTQQHEARALHPNSLALVAK